MTENAEQLTDDELVDGYAWWATGSHRAEAAVGLLIAHRLWLQRSDFREQAVWLDCGEHELENAPIVGVDWDAAIDLRHQLRRRRASTVYSP